MRWCGCGSRGEDNATGRYWIPNLCLHWKILHRNGVEDPSTGGFVASQGDGGIPIPYKGYIEAILPIPDFTQYNEDVIFLVIPDHKYWERVPVQIGTQVIDHLVVTMTKKELQQAEDTWKQVHLNPVISNRNTVKDLNVSKHILRGVKGEINTMRDVVIQLFATTIVKGIANLMMHSKCMNVVVEPVTGYFDHIAMTRYYGVLKWGRGRIDVCFRNHSTNKIPLPKQTAVVEFTAENVILALLAPKPTGDESGKG